MLGTSRVLPSRSRTQFRPGHAVAAAAEPVGREPAPVRLQGDACVVVDGGKGADHPVPPAMLAGATRALAQLVALHPQGVGDLQRLDRRVHGVGHVALDAVHAVAVGAPALPPGDGLDVGVGRPLRGSMPPTPIRFMVPWLAAGNAARRELREGLQHSVGDTLRRFRVASTDCSRRLRVEERAWWNVNRHGSQDAGIGGNGRDR